MNSMESESNKKRSILGRIEILLVDSGLSKARFARKIGYSERAFTQMLLKRSRPSAELVAAICGRLRIREQWLLSGDEPMNADAVPAAPPPDAPGDEYVRVKVSTHEELIRAALEARRTGPLSEEETEAVLLLREKSPDQRALWLKLLRQGTPPA